MADPSRDEFADRLDDLEETLEALQDELGPPRGPLGLPRPPTPGEVLRFSDEYAIPAAIAILEANVRMLELLQGVIRALDRGEDVGAARDRTVSLSRQSLDRLDEALDRLGTAIEESDLPQNADARRLLEEARSLNAEIDDRLARDDGPPGATGREPDSGVRIDVEDELEQLRDELDGDDEAADGDGDADA